MAALFVRLSPESRYRRFLTPKRELTPRELSYLTDIDHVHHEAFAAIDQREVMLLNDGFPHQPGERFGQLVGGAVHGTSEGLFR